MNLISVPGKNVASPGSKSNTYVRKRKKNLKGLFVGLLSHLTSKESVNAAARHQLYSQGDYHDPLMDVEHSSTFPKRQRSAGSARDGTGSVSCSLPWETVGSHLMDRNKLGQIMASKPGKKKHCRWGAIIVRPILGDVVTCVELG